MDAQFLEITRLLQSHRLPGLDLGEGMLYPHYKGYSLANLPSTICRWLEVPEPETPPLAHHYLDSLANTYDRVLLLLVDGLGLEFFQRYLEFERSRFPHERVWKDLLAEGLLFPMTSIVPSTTSAALTTLWTGKTVLEHGITGYEVWLKEYSLAANMILHSPVSFDGSINALRRAGFDPENFLPAPTLGRRLEQSGAKAYAFMHSSISRSGLSTMHLSQARVISYRTVVDLWHSLGAIMDRERGGRSYMYIYWGDLDELAHRYGPEDERLLDEFFHFGRQFAGFYHRHQKANRRKTLLAVTADHGQISTPYSLCTDLRRHPDFMSMLSIIPTGENRFAYLYPRAGKEEEIRLYVERTWPEQFKLIPSSELVKCGLLGEGRPYFRTLDRIGDFVLFALGQSHLWWNPNKENTMLGRHGGLSREEMLVPLIVFP